MRQAKGQRRRKPVRIRPGAPAGSVGALVLSLYLCNPTSVARAEEVVQGPEGWDTTTPPAGEANPQPAEPEEHPWIKLAREAEAFQKANPPPTGRCDTIPECRAAHERLQQSPTGRKIDYDARGVEILVVPQDQVAPGLSGVNGRHVRTEDGAGQILISSEHVRNPDKLVLLLAHEEQHVADDRREAELRRERSFLEKVGVEASALGVRLKNALPFVGETPDPLYRDLINTETNAFFVQRQVRDELGIECNDYKGPGAELFVDPWDTCDPLTRDQLREILETSPYSPLFNRRESITELAEVPTVARVPDDPDRLVGFASSRDLPPGLNGQAAPVLWDLDDTGEPRRDPDWVNQFDSEQPGAGVDGTQLVDERLFEVPAVESRDLEPVLLPDPVEPVPGSMADILFNPFTVPGSDDDVMGFASSRDEEPTLNDLAVAALRDVDENGEPRRDPDWVNQFNPEDPGAGVDGTQLVDERLFEVAPVESGDLDVVLPPDPVEPAPGSMADVLFNPFAVAPIDEDFAGFASAQDDPWNSEDAPADSGGCDLYHPDACFADANAGDQSDIVEPGLAAFGGGGLADPGAVEDRRGERQREQGINEAAAAELHDLDENGEPRADPTFVPPPPPEVPGTTDDGTVVMSPEVFAAASDETGDIEFWETDDGFLSQPDPEPGPCDAYPDGGCNDGGSPVAAALEPEPEPEPEPPVVEEPVEWVDNGAGDRDGSGEWTPPEQASPVPDPGPDSFGVVYEKEEKMEYVELLPEPGGGDFAAQADPAPPPACDLEREEYC